MRSIDDVIAAVDIMDTARDELGAVESEKRHGKADVVNRHEAARGRPWRQTCCIAQDGGEDLLVMKPASALSPLAFIDDADAQRAVRHLVTRHFFGTAAVVALVAALVFVFLPAGVAPAARWPLVLALAALGGLAASSLRAGAARSEDLVVLVVIAAIAVITLAVTLLDWGIAGPGFGFFGLLTCLVCTVAGLRLGLLVAGLGALLFGDFDGHRGILAPCPGAAWAQCCAAN